jgi:L-amino acid N-acyltransferase
VDAPHIRPAVRADCPAILEIYNEAVLTTTATYDYEPRTLQHRLEWFDAHEQAGLPVFVAEVSEGGGPGRVAGWASLNRFHDRPGYRFTVENSIYIEAASRGRGLGGLLLGELVRAARAGGYHSVIAVIDAANEASIRLHARHGFRPVAHFPEVGFKFGRWLDVVDMQLTIPIAHPPS